MSRASTYFLSWILIFFLINVWTITGVFAQDQASTKFGISFSSDLTDEEILNAVPDLLGVGVDVIELNSPVSAPLIVALSEFQIQLLVRSDFQFLTESEINNSDDINTQLVPFVLDFASKPNVVGIGVSSFSDQFSDEAILSLQKQVANSIHIILYQVGTTLNSKISTILLSDAFNSTQEGQNYIFEAPFIEENLNTFKRVYESNPKLILMDWYWFSDASSDQLFFAEAISIATSTSENLFPEIQSESEHESSEWPVIILVLLWISLGIHIRSNPTYRPLIFRYFTFHRFFVDDIMRYRERSSAPGITLFIQHAYFTGLVVLILSVTFISEKGLEAFYYHLPLLAIFGQNYFTLFVLSVIFALSLGFISLLWLYLPSKSMNHFSQVLSLYSWVFHVDFILVSILLILQLTEGSQTSILIFSTSHFLIWILAFIGAAFDSSKYLVKSRAKYLLNTVGIFLLVIGASIAAFLLSGYPFEVLQLAISL